MKHPVTLLLALAAALRIFAQGTPGQGQKFTFECGMAVGTCYSGSSTNGFAMGIIDTRAYSSAPLATNWYAPMWHGPASQPWTRANIGGEVFGLALDNASPPHVFAASTSVYGTPGNGRVVRADAVAGTLSTFINFTNVGTIALGNICYDPAHQQLFAADLDNGLIRRVKDLGATGTEQLPSYDHGLSGRPAASLPAIANSSAFNVLTDSGRRVFGLQTFQGRLYYSVWTSPSTNEIWSVGLNATGDFILAGTNGPRREIPASALPAVPAAWDRAVTDIAFSQSGRMLLGERTINLNATTTLAGYAHYSLVREFQNIGGTWTLSAQPEIGFYQPGNNIHANSAGGVDYDCADAKFATGDALRFDSIFLYGLQILPPGVSNVTQSVMIDYDADVTGGDKTMIGDVEVYRCCDCMTISDEHLECSPAGARNYTFTVQSHFADPISWLVFLSSTPGVSPATQLIPLPGPLTNGQSTTVTISLSIPAGETEVCYKLAAHNEKFEECCSVTHCVPVSECCAVITNEKFDLNAAAGAAVYSFCVTNLSTNVVGYMYLVGDTNCVTFQTNIITFSPPLAPGQGACLSQPVVLSPNCTNACFQLVMAGTNFVQCCSVEHCFGTRTPPENHPPLIRCEGAVETCFSATTPVNSTIYVLDPEGDPVRVILKIDGVPAQTNIVVTTPANSWIPVNFSFTLAPGTHVVTYCVWDRHGPQVICETTYKIGDQEAPKLQCPPDYKVCGVQKYTIPNLTLFASFGVSDNCSKSNEIKVAQSPPPGTVVGQGITCVTLTATDLAGNTATCQTCVTVKLVCIDTDFPATALVEGSDVTIHVLTDQTIVRQVHLLVDGKDVSQSSTPPYDLVWSRVPSGPHTIWAQADVITGEKVLSDPVLTMAGPLIRSAAAPALIVDSRSGQFGFILYTIPGEKCYIEFTPTLNPSNWQTVEETIGDGAAHRFDIQPSNAKAGFYRVRLDN